MTIQYFLRQVFKPAFFCGFILKQDFQILKWVFGICQFENLEYKTIKKPRNGAHFNQLNNIFYFTMTLFMNPSDVFTR